MKITKLLLLLIIIPSFVFSQISQVIEYEKSKYSSVTWPIVGSFEFKELPKPLTSSKVNFTIEAQFERSQDCKIRVYYDDVISEVLSDTIITWPGPIKKGDKFTGVIEFIPLLSGQFSIALGIQDDNIEKNNLQIYWWLDEDGNLLYLGKEIGMGKMNQDAIVTYFFNEDSVIIKQHAGYRKLALFEQVIIIKPTPQIGQISNCICRLRPNRVPGDKLKAQMITENIDLVAQPSKWNIPIKKDEVIEINFDFTPRKISAFHEIMFNFGDCELIDNSMRPPHCSQNSKIIMMFQSDGKLKYISDVGFRNQLKDRLPANLPKQLPSVKPMNTINLID